MTHDRQEEINLNYIKHAVCADDITQVINAAASAKVPLRFDNINVLDDKSVNGKECPCFFDNENREDRHDNNDHDTYHGHGS